jgi:hypothetical protein
MPSSPRPTRRRRARCRRHGRAARDAACGPRGHGACDRRRRARRGRRRTPPAARTRRYRNQRVRSLVGRVLAPAVALGGVAASLRVGVLRVRVATVTALGPAAPALRTRTLRTRTVRPRTTRTCATSVGGTCATSVGGACGPGASGPPALDALGGEVLVRRPVVVVLLIIARSVVIVVILGTRTGPGIGSAATLVRPRRPTAQKRHPTPPGRARPCGDASEARAAIYASLPRNSRAPCNRHWFHRFLPTSTTPVCRITNFVTE